MPSKKAIALLAASTLAITTWAGYRAECRVMDSAGNKPITLQSVVRRVTAPKARTQQIDKLNELRHRAGHSQPSPDETAAAWKIIRAMSAEDVKAYLEEIPMEPRRRVNEALISMLFFRWGQLDPEAAAEMAGQPAYNNLYTIAFVATAWADHDPEGAMRLADKSGRGFVQQTVGNAVGKMLVQQDPATALERAIAEFPATAVNGVAKALADRPGETEESRRATLLRLAGLTNNGQALTYYVRALASRVATNPELSQSLLAEIDRSGLPEERLAEIKNDLKYSFYRHEPPVKITEVDSSLPEARQNATYSSWSINEPDKAIAWAAQNGRADLVENAVKQQSMSLLRTNWQPGVRDERGSPYVKGVIQQYEAWRKLDAAAAETWLKTMPSDMRKHLSSSPNDATR
ncbi:hypothetical protein [Haloferula sp. BvORR071]|uniref:hypothetical protein n=1 Tax=Haloferula sp. BvORR071 TaxID=1396141 RepID=UPI00054D557E|nr:hypothetical protein [Haloferula sp. BvORR071]